MSQNKNKIYFLLINLVLFTILFIIMDQLIKYWMFNRHPFFITKNYGMFFGWVNEPIVGYLLLFIGLLALLLMIVKSNLIIFLNRISLALILAGALSNLVDRLKFGYVIDYLNLGLWPKFNLADIFIVLGVIIYGYQIFRHK